METNPPPLPLDEKPPGSLKVFGILNIVFGAIGLISVLPSLGLYYTSLDGKVGPMPELLRSDAFYLSVMRIITIPGTIFVFAQFISGFGLLKALEWARRVAIGCAIYGIVSGLFVGWLTMTRVMPFVMKQALAQAPGPKDPAVEQMTNTVAMVSGGIGIFIGMLLPVLMLFFLTRPKVRNYCIATSRSAADA